VGRSLPELFGKLYQPPFVSSTTSGVYFFMPVFKILKVVSFSNETIEISHSESDVSISSMDDEPKYGNDISFCLNDWPSIKEFIDKAYSDFVDGKKYNP
jgi:hypothetical protein